MNKLPLQIKSRGQTFTQIERTDNAAIYKSSWGHYEVFRIIVQKESEAFGVKFSEREAYPGNSQFGNTAWCFKSLSKAANKYDEIK